MIRPIKALLSAKRKNKRIITITYDVIAVVISLYMAMSLRLNDWMFDVTSREVASFILTIIVTIYAFMRLGMYRAVLRYMMLPALGYIFPPLLIIYWKTIPSIRILTELLYLGLQIILLQITQSIQT